MDKRGQVTIFIIIAIILIASVALFFIFKDRLGIGGSRSNDPVYLFVESCVESTGEDAIYHIIQNGGYLLPPPASTLGGSPYYYYNNKNHMPSKSKIENEISAYMEESLSYCTSGFVNFPDLNITEGEIEARTTIEDEEIIFDVEYPVKIKKGEKVTILEDFNGIRIVVRVGALYDSIEKMIQDQLGEKGICLSCMSELADREGFTIDMTNTEEGVIFTVRDEYSKIKDVPIEWMFANRY